MSNSKDDFSEGQLKGYEDRFQASWLRDELYRVRNFRQTFQSGFWMGAMKAGLQYLFGGMGRKRIKVEPDFRHMKKTQEAAPRPQPHGTTPGDVTVSRRRKSREYGRPTPRRPCR